MDELKQLFRLRHQIFVQFYGWSGIYSFHDAYECDQWDACFNNPTYIVVLDDAGTVMGGCRFISATQRTMFEELYSDALFEPHPKSDRLIEVHRFTINPKLSRPLQEATAAALQLTTAEYSLQNSIDACMVFTDVRIAEGQFSRAMDKIGPPVTYDDGTFIALKGTFSEGNVEALQAIVDDRLRQANDTGIAA